MSDSAAPLHLLGAAAAGGAVVGWLAARRAQAEVLRKVESRAAAERAGRIKAERAAREEAQARHHADGYQLSAIGHVKTPFAERRGTPRQGAFCPSARGVLKLSGSLAPAMLEGLEGYSHVWLLYVFHENTNVHRIDSRKDRGFTFPAKVRPPMLGGRKLGVFACRTPHRPNPIGLTACTIERVDLDARELHLAGVDLVDGTPVLDLKPYLPAADCIEDASAPGWAAGPNSDQVPADFHVTFSASALSAVKKAVEMQCVPGRKSQRLYQNSSELQQIVQEVLALDIRSVYRGKGSTVGSEEPYILRLDGLEFTFVTLRDQVHVLSCSQHSSGMINVAEDT